MIRVTDSGYIGEIGLLFYNGEEKVCLEFTGVFLDASVTNK